MNLIARICLHNAACDDGVTLKRLRINASDIGEAKELIAVVEITSVTIYDAARRRFSEDSQGQIWESKGRGETTLAHKNGYAST